MSNHRFIALCLVLGFPLLQVLVDLRLMFQVIGNSCIYLDKFQRRKVIANLFSALALSPIVYNGIKRNAAPAHIIAPVAHVDIGFIHRLLPPSLSCSVIFSYPFYHSPFGSSGSDALAPADQEQQAEL